MRDRSRAHTAKCQEESSTLSSYVKGERRQPRKRHSPPFMTMIKETRGKCGFLTSSTSSPSPSLSLPLSWCLCAAGRLACSQSGRQAGRQTGCWQAVDERRRRRSACHCSPPVITASLAESFLTLPALIPAFTFIRDPDELQWEQPLSSP